MERPGIVHSEKIERLPLAKIPINELIVSSTPRSLGEDQEHIRVMAGAENPLPPILVHRPSMRVLDGIHRLRAAELRGDREIEARLFDGDEASSFVLAVHENTTHGLPLSLADRKIAAARILDFYPQWSDRAIASVAGLAHRTVAAMRKCPSGQNNQMDTRIGRDGRRRPRDSTERRELARELLADNPGASLRQIARAVRMSPESVRSLRAEAARNADTPPRRAEEHSASRREPAKPLDGAAAWRALRADPAFRSTEAGRLLLRVLGTYQALHEHDQRLVDDVPPHCMAWVASAARACAQAWQDLADRAEQRGRTFNG